MSEVLKVWNTILYYEQFIKGYVCWKCQKKLKNHCKGCNAVYVKSVKRNSKYTVRTHNVFAHNFLNIQLIFNLKKALESWDLCWSLLKVLKVKNNLQHL